MRLPKMPRPAFRIPRQAFLLTVGFVTLALTSALSFWFVERVQDQAWNVAHGLEVDNTLLELQLQLRRAQAGQRGYLLTGLEAEADRFYAAAEAVPELLAALHVLVADNPLQDETLSRLEPIVAARLAELETGIDLADAGDLDAAVALVAQTTIADPTAGPLLELIETMRAEEERLLADQLDRLARTRGWVLAGSIFGILLVVALAGLSLLFVRRTTARLQQTGRQLATVNQRLEEKVNERTAALQEANEEVQRFAYIVSHDLRSPLVNIMGFTSEIEALRDDLKAAAATDDPQATARREEISRDFDEALGFIKSSIGKMDRLINAILQLSRAGRREFDPRPVDLDATVRAIADSLAHQLQEAEAEIAVAPLPTIVTDRLAVEQILSNLLDNAVKYLRDGVPGRIEVSAVERSTIVALRIADNGRGIDARDRERVFELFRRAGKQDRAGEGIGLAHVRMLVRRIGGRISLESEPGRGSVFTLFLPKVMAAETQEPK